MYLFNNVTDTLLFYVITILMVFGLLVTFSGVESDLWFTDVAKLYRTTRPTAIAARAVLSWLRLEEEGRPWYYVLYYLSYQNLLFSLDLQFIDVFE